mmetsp:Transcript_19076/g.56913  ORF Transcript_19076/g.56913 Transcript_19076/m.56913 type:complete len:180 (-) Transcript_19076:170-709(-)
MSASLTSTTRLATGARPSIPPASPPAPAVRRAPRAPPTPCESFPLPPRPPPTAPRWPRPSRYIQPRGRQCCRVYYSCDTKLRKWVPAPVYALLSKTAVKQATIWVNNEAVSEWAKLRQQQGGGGPLGLGGAMRSARDAWERALPKGRAEPWKLPRLPWARPTSLTVRGLGAHPRHLSQC